MNRAMPVLKNDSKNRLLDGNGGRYSVPQPTTGISRVKIAKGIICPQNNRVDPKFHIVSHGDQSR